MTSKLQSQSISDADRQPTRKPRVGRILGATLFLMALLTVTLGPRGGVTAAVAASDTPADSGQPSSEVTRMQVFFQRRFRLPSASDVEVGPAKTSAIPGLSVRIVKMHNDTGQSGTFVVYVDAIGKTAIL